MSNPNLLIVYTDEQSWWTIGAYGADLIETPNIDRLADEGVRFNQFFTNNAWCTPSRGCFFTGRYPHQNGAYANHLALNRDEVTFAEVLRRQGYDTGYAGKWHLDGSPNPGFVHPERSMGFTDCRCMYNRGSWKRFTSHRRPEAQPIVVSESHPLGDEKTYITDYLTNETIDFIRRPRTNPFCYVLSINDPHPNYIVRPPYDTMFRPEDMPIPPTFYREDLPSWADTQKARGPFGPGTPNREDILRKSKAAYLGMVKLIDDNVGRLFGTLEEQGILDDTIIVFTTDHGDYMGEHGLRGKNRIFETVYRIPLLIRWPERVAAGTEVDRICATVDFQQTLLGLMDVPPSGRERGRDASPLIRGEETAWEDDAFLHHSESEFAGIFTPEYQLALHRGGESILFDRRNDPGQVANLFGRPEYQAIVDDLTRHIVSHHEETASPALEWLRRLQGV